MARTARTYTSTITRALPTIWYILRVSYRNDWYKGEIMKTTTLVAGALVAWLSIGCLPGLAQLVSGNLTGTIYDASGATVPNASVVAHNDATGIESTTNSLSAGEYHISNLPPEYIPSR